jgi:hypothetical protein
VDREALERLLIDSALVALPADSEALLRAYLAADADAAATAKRFDLTADLARRAMHDGRQAALPPFPLEGLVRAERRHRWAVGLRTGFGLAACLALGLGLGSVLFRGQRNVAPPGLGGEVQIAQAGPDRTESRPSMAVSGFWSTERLKKQAVVTEPSQTPRLIWDSPVARPRLGGST